ncbi:MAG: hypothetical protein MAG451_00568 [Anaerolineales bacterium]|nr:hypothetical protein [Anaerolineales bacterium]
MGFLDRWLDSLPDEPEEIEDDWELDEDEELEQLAVDVSEPRECIYKSFADDPGPCLRCGERLEQSAQPYLVATRRGKRITDSFITGSDFGWFCTNCPTVVIDPDDVDEMLQHPMSGWDVGEEFTVVGLIDLDAIPEDKQHLPLGDDDNPIPLVEFTSISDAEEVGRRSQRRKRGKTSSDSEKGKRRRRRRRR